MNKKVTVLGGGTGMSYLLQGLKGFPIDITAVITVSDNGRSTGKLRQEFNIPAVGDVRKVISNISELDPVVKELMEYEFKTSSDLDGHKVGNLILTALFDITGSFEKSIETLSKLLDVRHKVLPISEDSSLILIGETKDRDIIEGEENITKANREIVKIYYKEEPHVTESVLDSIENSDLIIFSMGSLYTSILPNIICKKVKEALDKTKAPIMYLCNAMTQPGETDKFTVADHIKLINSYLNNHKIDIAIANSAPVAEETAKKYEIEEQKDPVILDEEEVRNLDVELISGDFLTIIDNTIRHNSLKLSSEIFSYLMRD